MYPVLFVLILIIGIGVGIASLLTVELKSQRGLPGAQEAFSAADVGIERMKRIDSCIAISDEGDRFDCLAEYAEVANPPPNSWKCKNAGFDYDKCLEGAIGNISPGTLASGATYELEVVKQGGDCDQPVCFFSTGTFNDIVRKIELKRTTASLLPCGGDIDVMLVLDKSGSISKREFAQLKDAAKAFVDELNLSADTVHMGQVSFSEEPPDLDQHLTDSSAALYAAVDSLEIENRTFMASALTLAKQELDNPGDGHDRPDNNFPDFIVFITDGNPDDDGDDVVPSPTVIAAADAAKAASIKIVVVGVGIVAPGAEDFLRDDIATDPSYYRGIDDFEELKDELKNLCG